MNIFDYSDYRLYLRDFYLRQKAKSPAYSFRAFAMRAKLNSPNYLKLVIDGDRRITDRNLPHFIRGLRLARPESDYFKALVSYAESKDLDAKESLLRELIKLRGRSMHLARELEQDRLEILRAWHHWAIRELVLLQDFREDADWIARKLRGKITPKQARESLELLERLRFIRREEAEKGGRFVLSDPLLTTADEASSQLMQLLIKELHRQFIDLGKEALFEISKEERETAGLTIAVPRARVGELKQAIKEFRRELNQSFTATHGNEEVYHLTVNFFPLTTPSQPTHGNPAP